jgi:hypothetical protein
MSLLPTEEEQDAILVLQQVGILEARSVGPVNFSALTLANEIGVDSAKATSLRWITTSYLKSFS